MKIVGILLLVSIDYLSFGFVPPNIGPKSHQHKHWTLFSSSSTTNTLDESSPSSSSQSSSTSSSTDDNDTKEEKILLWLSKGRRVEAIRDMREEDAGSNERALTSGAARFEGRYSASDWLYNFFTLPHSSILSEIKSPIILTTLWAALVSLVHFACLRAYNGKFSRFAKHMVISDKPHSLMVSALSLLLVFRTNSAYQRFAEGRKIWERILTLSRDLTRMTTLFRSQIGKEKRRRVQRLLAAFPYLLRHRIRPNIRMNRLSDTSKPRDPEHSLLLYDDSALFENDTHAAMVASDEEESGRSRRKTRELYWVDKRVLPWRLLPGSALADCARAQNRPLWVCDRMSAELYQVPDQEGFSNRERLLLLGIVDKISHTIGECERIHQTVVPLNYARHCLRGVTLWLLTLPFCLVETLGLLTGPCLTIISWLLYGIYQIGYKIEDPFQSTLRLSILCDAVRRDVFAEEMLQRDTAFDFEDEKEEKVIDSNRFEGNVSSTNDEIKSEKNESEPLVIDRAISLKKEIELLDISDLHMNDALGDITSSNDKDLSKDQTYEYDNVLNASESLSAEESVKKQKEKASVVQGEDLDYEDHHVSDVIDTNDTDDELTSTNSSDRSEGYEHGNALNTSETFSAEESLPKQKEITPILEDEDLDYEDHHVSDVIDALAVNSEKVQQDDGRNIHDQIQSSKEPVYSIESQLKQKQDAPVVDDEDDLDYEDDDSVTLPPVTQASDGNDEDRIETSLSDYEDDPVRNMQTTSLSKSSIADESVTSDEIVGVNFTELDNLEGDKDAIQPISFNEEKAFE